jgi:hypothetical protein
MSRSPAASVPPQLHTLESVHGPVGLEVASSLPPCRKRTPPTAPFPFGAHVVSLHAQVRPLADPVVMASVELYRAVCRELLPMPAKSHYP